ncbi:MFS transporter [Tengunoibacter tsumagoiensis]|uniref:MFS transporter n=1 Tax=Tengunoibacter tsumagoiensis TaxID=2014871 RepID=A0A401ZYP0_9CHLR|nr:MFS transporter [Tengunoibacter tsumagoiensis]GCE11957.1 MFS transporter [Tengunoibacter tsumagoiensis]
MKTTNAKLVDRILKSELLINRNYAFLFTGQIISQIGDQISTYTLVLWIVTIIADGQSWAPLAMSGVLVISMVPSLLVGPLAGVFVDRWDNRLTMIRMDVIRALLSFSLVFFTGIIPWPFFTSGHPPLLVQLGAIYVVTFLNSICSQFFSPANMGLLAKIVPQESRPKAAGLSQTMQAFAAIVGPPLAAPLLFTMGLQWALLFDAFTFCISFFTIWVINTPIVTQEKVVNSTLWNEFTEGLRFSFGNHLIRTIIIASFIATFGAGAFDALYIFFLPNNLYTPVSFAGFVGAALGGGMIGGAFVGGKFASKIGLKRLLYLSLAGLGLCVIIMSRMTSFIPALPLFFIFGALLAAMRVAASPLLLNETPPKLIGRVISVLTPLSLFASLFSAISAGYVASVLLAKVHFQIAGIYFRSLDSIFIVIGLLFLSASLYAYYALHQRRSMVSKVRKPIETVTIEDSL